MLPATFFNELLLCLPRVTCKTYICAPANAHYNRLLGSVCRGGCGTYMAVGQCDVAVGYAASNGVVCTTSISIYAYMYRCIVLWRELVAGDSADAGHGALPCVF